jgi:malic enzyme
MGGAAAVVTKAFKKKPASAPVMVAPTVAEVSQSKAADAYDPRKTKARGRSSTIITSSKGVEDETITLGKKSLLGS